MPVKPLDPMVLQLYLQSFDIKSLMMRKKHNKKLFIIDTNVLLHDYLCIYNFEENDVIIPIVVLEELDKFKRGNDLINFHAREFTRELDKLVRRSASYCQYSAG